MMSQTNAEKSPNTIPLSHVIDIRINQEYLGTTESKDLLRGWEKWSLKDIIPIFNSAIWRFCLSASGYFGEIVFLKLLEGANNQNISFELIEEVVRTILRTKIGITSDNVFGLAGFQYGAQVLCNFFKEFVKQGEKDVRYYNLIYEMLTYQTVRNKSFPLGFKARRGNGWNEEVFAKLPWEMQEILRSESFYSNEGNKCYALFSEASFGM